MNNLSLFLGTQSIARRPNFPSAIWGLEDLRCHHKLTGSGTTIAIIDGGIASSHSSLAGRTLIDGHNFVPGFTEKDWHGPTGMDNHGTAVAAVVGGREFISASTVVPHGIAPEAGLYICRVFHNNKHYNVPNALPTSVLP